MRRHSRAALKGLGMLHLPKKPRRVDLADAGVLPSDYLDSLYTIDSGPISHMRANNRALVGGAATKRRRITPSLSSLPQPVVPKKTSYKPLKFANPFYSSGAKKYAFPTFNSVMSSNGLTSIEQFTKQLQAARYQELLNSGFKMGDHFASISLGEDGNDTLTTPLPNGVRNVEERDKQIDAMKKIEMQNAGIFDKETTKRMQMYKVLEKRRKEKEKDKYIQWLSEHYDEVDIPPEYAEAVRAQIEKNKMGATSEEKKSSAINSATKGVNDQATEQGQSKIKLQTLTKNDKYRPTLQQIAEIERIVKDERNEQAKAYIKLVTGNEPSPESLKQYTPDHVSAVIGAYRDMLEVPEGKYIDDYIGEKGGDKYLAELDARFTDLFGNKPGTGLMLNTGILGMDKKQIAAEPIPTKKNAPVIPPHGNDATTALNMTATNKPAPSSQPQQPTPGIPGGNVVTTPISNSTKRQNSVTTSLLPNPNPKPPTHVAPLNVSTGTTSKTASSAKPGIAQTVVADARNGDPNKEVVSASTMQKIVQAPGANNASVDVAQAVPAVSEKLGDRFKRKVEAKANIPKTKKWEDFFNGTVKTLNKCANLDEATRSFPRKEGVAGAIWLLDGRAEGAYTDLKSLTRDKLDSLFKEKMT